MPSQKAAMTIKAWFVQVVGKKTWDRKAKAILEIQRRKRQQNGTGNGFPEYFRVKNMESYYRRAGHADWKEKAAASVGSRLKARKAGRSAH